MVTLDGYPVDVFVTEEHVFEAEITRSPIEKGAPATDSRQRKPATVTVEGIISDTPLGEVARDPTRLGSTKPSEDALAFLMAIDEAGDPISITTALRRYESMDLQTLSIPKTAQTGKALRFRATFTQVTIITNKRTTVRTAAPRSKRKSKRGTKPSATIDTSKATFQVERDRSMALQGAQAFGGLF